MGVVAKGKSKPKTAAKHPFLEKTPKSFRIGGSPLPKRDLSRVVRFPAAIQLQRKRAVLVKRLKTPGAIKQFQDSINKNEATQLFRLLLKYRPETPEAKKERLVAEAKAREGGKEPTNKKPVFMKHGLNHVTELVEQKKAKLVMIAHDVDPIEQVVWLPHLCKKMEVPYCIVKGKARLGALVHQKTAAVVAIDNVKKEDQAELDQLIQNFYPQFNEKKIRHW
eukprot:Gregarina_sp_Poly_1__4442@NODE_2395_length_2186_cov_440_081642_g1524_i0_p1_GENE_NODE_2395_length_2186_cov_440_081642_g1524_i0NODE_2395_length_2186_cov_440_081642_g1524_i0_p1_ORF_typecomplete_len222_score44_63Ribosomal_L7Ae/PF01248_26/1_8e24GTPbdg_N/PF13167_6/1_2GTPbdg_N/PF13167_6/7e02_NODE_2395_length_2186_cov_440_081642_g1524_i08521517